MSKNLVLTDTSIQTQKQLFNPHPYDKPSPFPTPASPTSYARDPKAVQSAYEKFNPSTTQNSQSVSTTNLPGSKSQSTTPTVFDIVNNYDWTYSENKKRFQAINQEGIPYIELSEMRIKSSTILSKLRSLVSSAGDATRAIEGTAKEIINAVGQAIGVKFGGSSLLSDSITNITKFTADYGVGYIPNQNAGSEYLKPYTQLYITEPTNISYKFPYFSNNFLAVNNSFSDTYQGFGKTVQGAIDSMAEGMADLALAIPSLIQPGVYIERPQYYNFAQEPDSIEVKFPLLNTLHAGSYAQNLEFINRFMLMNKPHRISKVLVDPPAIYSINQPGVAYYPYAYIKRMTVEHIGTKRLVGENLVPDAFLVTLTIQPLTKEANNYMLVGHGKNNYIGADSDSAGKIQLYVVQTSGPAAIPQGGGGSTGGSPTQSTQPVLNIGQLRKDDEYRLNNPLDVYDPLTQLQGKPTFVPESNDPANPANPATKRDATRFNSTPGINQRSY